MTNPHLRDEYIALATLLFKMSFEHVVQLVEQVPMHGFDEISMHGIGHEQLRALTEEELLETQTWLAKFVHWFERADDAETALAGLRLHGEDSIGNLRGFVLTDLMKHPVIQLAYNDADSALGALLRAQRAYADELLQASSQHVALPAKFARRIAALESASERDRVVGLHILGLIDAHERDQDGCLPDLKRTTLARRAVEDITQMRLTMPDGRKIGRLTGVGPLSAATIIKDIIAKYVLLPKGEVTPRPRKRGSSRRR